MSPRGVVGSSHAAISSPSRQSGCRLWMTAIEGTLVVVTSTHLAVMAAGLPQVRAVMRWRTIRPRLRLLPSERGAAETASSASPATVCGICRRAVDAYQHWPRGVFARSADERSSSYDAIRPIGSFARRPFFAQALPPRLCGRPAPGLAGTLSQQRDDARVVVGPGATARVRLRTGGSRTSSPFRRRGCVAQPDPSRRALRLRRGGPPSLDRPPAWLSRGSRFVRARAAH